MVAEAEGRGRKKKKEKDKKKKPKRNDNGSEKSSREIEDLRWEEENGKVWRRGHEIDILKIS